MEAARTTPCLKCRGATALLVAFLSTLTPRASLAAEWNPGPKTTPDTQRFVLEGSSGALDPVLARGLLDSDHELQRNATAGQEGNVFVDNQSPEQPPVDFLNLAPVADTVAAATLISTDGDSSLSLAGSGIQNESNKSVHCLGCSGEIDNERLHRDTESLAVKHNESALEASGVLGHTPGPTGQESTVWELGGTKVTGESQEDMGSGDQHLRTPAVVATFSSSIEKEWSLGTFLGSTTTLFPSPRTTAEGTSMAREPGNKSLSLDSAETDHLLQVVLQTPNPNGKPANPSPKQVSKTETSSDPETEQHLPSEIWIETASSLPAQGSSNLTLPLKEMESWADNTPPPSVLKPPEPPSKKLLPEIIDDDYYDHSYLDSHSDLEHFPGEDSTKTVQDKKKSSWVTSDLYNDFTTFDESDFYPTTSFYTDGDEEGGAEDDEEEEMEAEDGTIGEPEVEEDFKLKTHTPKLQTTVHSEKPTSVQQAPQQTFITSQGELYPKSISETMKEPTQILDSSSNSSTECKNGYLRHNRTCKSVCDIYPSYCYNGGQCYLVENSGAFCRCNTQDYIWHKGVRCESIITDFQVMCVAVGTAALVVLLLFMMTVFFAKKLYLLKTENYKLRKRNRYRTPSELHNDNFSLSTIAEGSHPNEDPNAIHKLQEPTKSFVKDEEPFNIHSAMSPKHGCDTGGLDSLEVNCLQNNLT